MAHFAQLDANNVVTEVIVINNAVVEDLPFPESEPIGVAFCQSLYGADTVWKQTSYNGNFRGVYAGIGFTYDSTLDQFIAPSPKKEIAEVMAFYEERIGKIPNDSALESP
jgi:hypothetical protein